MKTSERRQEYTVTQIADMRPGTPPRVISDAFYARRLDPSRCRKVKRRLRIPQDYMDEVLAYLDSRDD